MTIKPLLALGLCCLIWLSACTSETETAALNAQIERFHQLYNAQEPDVIYQEIVSSGYRDLTPLAKHRRLHALLYKAMGPFHQSETTLVNKQVNTKQSTLTMTATSHFVQGNAVETFIFVTEGSEPKLLGYHLDSAELLKYGDEFYAFINDLPEPEVSSSPP